MKFIKNIKRIIPAIKNYKLTKTLLTAYWNGYLYEIGWMNSFLKQKPVSLSDEPLPWVTYPFIDFLKGRLDNSLLILEYGSGNSTLFYSLQVKRVYAVEHDMEWFNKISGLMPKNVELTYQTLEKDGAYSRFAEKIGVPIDIVIVDGRDRVNCVKHCLNSLTRRGVVVLDDSEREEYGAAIDYLLERGFRKIDFWGIAPGVFYKKCTSLFYKGENCLNV